MPSKSWPYWLHWPLRSHASVVKPLLPRPLQRLSVLHSVHSVSSRYFRSSMASQRPCRPLKIATWLYIYTMSLHTLRVVGFLLWTWSLISISSVYNPLELNMPLFLSQSYLLIAFRRKTGLFRLLSLTSTLSYMLKS
jgi:hypothetical protein